MVSLHKKKKKTLGKQISALGNDILADSESRLKCGQERSREQRRGRNSWYSITEYVGGGEGMLYTWSLKKKRKERIDKCSL